MHHGIFCIYIYQGSKNVLRFVDIKQKERVLDEGKALVGASIDHMRLRGPTIYNDLPDRKHLITEKTLAKKEKNICSHMFCFFSFCLNLYFARLHAISQPPK